MTNYKNVNKINKVCHQKYKESIQVFRELLLYYKFCYTLENMHALCSLHQTDQNRLKFRLYH